MRTGSGTRLAAVAAASGFRRVDRVRIVVLPDGERAEVCGVLHRYPQTVGVSLATANRLIAAGALVEIDLSQATSSHDRERAVPA